MAEDRIKEIDMFGHPIELNFNRSGSRHKTVIGGFFSIFIKGALLFFAVIIITRVFTYDDNKERQHSYLIEMDADSPEALLDVKYSGMRAKVFLAIRRQFGEMIDESEDVLTAHLTVTAVQQDIDWYKVNTDQFNIETYFRMRRCTQDDFGDDALAEKLFASWAGYMIMCPELVNEDGKELTFSGAKGMMRTSSVTFRVEKCRQGSRCRSEQEINEYIQDISVQTWIIQEQINFRDQQGRPTSKKMDLVDVQSLPFSTKKGERQLLHHSTSYLQHNMFSTEDSWIWLGQTTLEGDFYTFSKSI